METFFSTTSEKEIVKFRFGRENEDYIREHQCLVDNQSFTGRVTIVRDWLAHDLPMSLSEKLFYADDNDPLRRKYKTEILSWCEDYYKHCVCQRLAEWRRTLEFYADGNNWKDCDTGIGPTPGPAIDYGAAAQEALKGTNK